MIIHNNYISKENSIVILLIESLDIKIDVG
jgi:hypothetical protein